LGGTTVLEGDNSTIVANLNSIVTPLMIAGKNSKLQNLMKFEDSKKEENPLRI
jgi:hypothetical protein